VEILIARSKPKAPPALTPDEQIKTGKDGRIRLIEKRKPRRSSTSRPSTSRPSTSRSNARRKSR
jgi:hypothetical protein